MFCLPARLQADDRGLTQGVRRLPARCGGPAQSRPWPNLAGRARVTGHGRRRSRVIPRQHVRLKHLRRVAHSRGPDLERPAADRDLARLPRAVPEPGSVRRATFIAGHAQGSLPPVAPARRQHPLRAFTREDIQRRAYFLLVHPPCGWDVGNGVRSPSPAGEEFRVVDLGKGTRLEFPHPLTRARAVIPLREPLGPEDGTARWPVEDTGSDYTLDSVW